jgi:adhesin/invasin
MPVEGATTVPFTATSSLIDHDDTAVLIANMGASSAQVTLSLLGLKPTALACPQTLQSGLPLSCQVTLNSGQATTSVPIAISGNGQLVALPGSVPTVAGQSTISFQGNTTYVSSDQSLTISASFHGVALQATVTLTPAPPVLTVPGLQTVVPGRSVAFTVSATDPAGLTVTLSVTNLPPDSSFNPNTGVFNWTPQTSQVGQYSVAFTATNTAQVSATEDVAIEVQSTTPIISSLTNAASFVNSGCSPGAVATLLGTGFTATGAKSAEVSPLPTTIDGLHVQGNGSDLPVFYVSEDQVNFQCPQAAPGASVSLMIQSGTGASSPLPTTMQIAAPGIFTMSGSGKGQGAVLVAGTANVAMTKTKGILSQPAPRGGYISIYATGLGATNIIVAPGAPAPTDPLAEVIAPVDVVLGGEPAEVSFAGLVPGYTGLYVVNAKIPATASIGPAIPLEIDVQLPDGTIARSNVVTIAVAPAGN